VDPDGKERQKQHCIYTYIVQYVLGKLIVRGASILECEEKAKLNIFSSGEKVLRKKHDQRGRKLPISPTFSNTRIVSPGIPQEILGGFRFLILFETQIYQTFYLI